MHASSFFAFMLLLSLHVAGGPLEDLQSNFHTRCDFAEADRDLQLKKLDDAYVAAIDRQVEKIKATGKLDAVIPFIEEVKAVKAGTNPLPELPEGTSLELKQIRAKHSEARAKILKSHAEAVTSLAAKMEAALKSKEQELTKAGKFEDALAAKHMRESLEKDKAIIAARDKLVESNITPSTGAWRSLLVEESEITSKGMYDVVPVSQVTPAMRLTTVLGGFVNSLKARKENPEQILIAVPDTTIEYKLAIPATQARGTIHLANADGSVRFKVHAGNKIVFDRVLKGEVTDVPFEVNFTPTKSIRLETDQMGTETHDWSAWIEPEIR